MKLDGTTQLVRMEKYFDDEELGIIHELLTSGSIKLYERPGLREKLVAMRNRRLDPEADCYCGDNCTCGG